jgi:hypothetical protein
MSRSIELEGPEEFGDREFELDELREFLSADRMDVPTDPLFKERLRRKLWRMLQRYWGGASNARS